MVALWWLSEVHCFRLIKIYSSKLIAIDYISGAIESFPIDNLTMK